MLKSREMFSQLTTDESAQIIAPNVDNGWRLVRPIPVGLDPVFPRHSRGKPSRVWTYRDEIGRLLGFVCRWDGPPGKLILPLTLWENDRSRQEWRWRFWPELRPLYGLDRLASRPDAPVLIVEGEKTADAAALLFPDFVAATSPAGAHAAHLTCWSPLEGRQVVIWPDNNAPGAHYAESVTHVLRSIGTRNVRLVKIPPELPLGWDLADPLPPGMDMAWLNKVLDRAYAVADCSSPTSMIRGDPEDWPEPMPIPDGLPPVAAMDPALLPGAIRSFAVDIAERMQCPLDFIGTSLMVAVGSVIGRQVAIRPQAETDWIEIPNLWCCVVGRPGIMKSPAMRAALSPLNALEAKFRGRAEADRAQYEIEMEAAKLRKEAAQKLARAALKADLSADVSGTLDIAEPTIPQSRRFIVSDATYEALGEILANNQNGVLVFRDELVSLLKSLDREDNAPARGFYLSAWSGMGSYTFDRIMRGQHHIDAACISLIGSTQPGRLSDYVARALRGGAADDGLIQRFGLLVYPDHSHEFKNVDRFPDDGARHEVSVLFENLAALDPDEIGAQRDGFGKEPFLRFTPAALEAFTDWRTTLERMLRSEELHPALESHFAKYRKVVPALALICHVATGGQGPVGEVPTIQALAWADYLASHAKRAYACAYEAETRAAKSILAHIHAGRLPVIFTLREIHQRGWSNLTDREAVQAGLDVLEDLEWLRRAHQPTGGRPKITFRVNPRGLK